MTAAKASFAHSLYEPDRWKPSKEIIAAWHGRPSPKGASKINGEVRLTDEQAALCRALLCQELMKVSSLLASGKDGEGRNLIGRSKQSLMGISSRLQVTLLALGMTSRELAGILKSIER